MLTRIEIDGFKTFENFSLDLRPFSAIVGPNASGKSNLFDALRFISLLAQTDIRSAMKDVRGLPEELFRRTTIGSSNIISFALEVLLPRKGVDPFGQEYEIRAQRLRYELRLAMKRDANDVPSGVYVSHERCSALARRDERASYVLDARPNYNSRISPFIRVNDQHDAIEIRQDDRQKHGRPVSLSLNEASRTALSTVTTAEFRHLYALKETLVNFRFLEINPSAARNSNDRFEERLLKPDASNLSATLNSLKDETSRRDRPDGVLSDIAADLAALIPSVSRLEVSTDQRQYSFRLVFADSLDFSSRVISDGTLRLLALLTVLDDPRRAGTLCFEEPENGVHEGRIPMLVEFLRGAAQVQNDERSPSFQILVNTHSPKVMAALQNQEIVAADSVVSINPVTGHSSARTRMRVGITNQDSLFNPEHELTRFEVERLLQKATDAA